MVVRRGRLARRSRGEQTVERERRSTSDLKQRFLAAATLTVAFADLDDLKPIFGHTE